MNNRERILSTFAGQPVDRPLFPAWLGFFPWWQTTQRWREESGNPELEIGTEFGFDPFFKCVPLEMGPFPHFEPEIIEEDEEFITKRNSRGIVAKDRKDQLSMPDFLDYPVHSPDEWLAFKEERLQHRLDERTAKLDEFLAGLSPDDAVQVGHFPWGAFGTARDIIGVEELLFGFYDHPEMIHDIMGTMTDLWLAIWEKVCDVVKLDHIHIWEDMSGKQGMLISPELVEAFMMPQYDKIVAFAEAHDTPIVSVDSDGNVEELVKIVVAHGINAFLPFEVQAGSDILEFRRDYPDLVILGGLDKRALAAGKEAMHHELNVAEKMLAQGRYVVGFDHLIPPDVPWENFKYFVNNLKTMIGV